MNTITRGLLVAGMVVLAARSVAAQCCGDCDGNGRVAINELVSAVNRALDGCRDDGICEAQPGGQRFPASGQTTCWNSAGTVIPCAGTDHDGDVQAGATLAYMDNGDGTITDNNTGLMWEKKSDDGSIHDKDAVYAWDDAFAAHVAVLKSSSFAGYSDWRVPNVKELQSIVNYEIAAPGPTVSPAFNTACAPSCTVTTCSCTQSGFHWSSTTYATSPLLAWGVRFLYGLVSYSDKPSNFYVRAVRGGL